MQLAALISRLQFQIVARKRIHEWLLVSLCIHNVSALRTSTVRFGNRPCRIALYAKNPAMAPPMHHKIPTIAKARSEEHTSELQSRRDLVCRLLLEKKKIKK